MLNYDPRNGEYVRISSIEITVLESLQYANVAVYHEWAIVVDGLPKRVENQSPIQPVTFTVKMNDMTQYPLFNANTGENYPSNTADGTVLTHLVSAIHQRRKSIL
jgi:hypothetical protein